MKSKINGFVPFSLKENNLQTIHGGLTPDEFDPYVPPVFPPIRQTNKPPRIKPIDPIGPKINS